MIREKRLLIVGGAGRNVGKTEFVCRLIARFAGQHDIYALKVSSVYPDEGLFHGSHADDEVMHQLFEEQRRETGKDSSRMLRAGAVKSYYLRSDDEGIREGFAYFCQQLPEKAIIVCESNSLGQFVHPGLYVMVRSVSGEVKPRAVSQLARADLVVVSDGGSGFPELEEIDLSVHSGWQLKGR